MIVKVWKDYEELSRQTAELIINCVHDKPDAVLCLAGGHTPRRTYELLVEAHLAGRVDFSTCTFVGLDEFVGIGREDEGSCLKFLYDTLFTPIGVKEVQVFFLDAVASDLDHECKRIDEVIANHHGGIDFILLGVGLNGHLGFNEPGVDFDLYAHVIDLDETSKTVGQKYFSSERELCQGITLGVKHILEAKRAVLIADGLKKAKIVARTVQEGVSNQIPSTVLKWHRDVYLFVDEEAGSMLRM